MAVWALCFGGCERCAGPHRAVESLPDLGYPTCDGDPLPEGELVGEGVLRSGPTMREQQVVERFEVRRRGCVIVARVAQEWPLGTAQLDVAFDADGLPLRVYRRTTIPDASGPLGHVDTRLFELRTEPIGVTHRTPAGQVERFQLLGGRPRAIIGPGRGLLTVWLQRADLPVGERLREVVLDVREPVAVLREVTLERREDQEVEGLGRVRVYTIYGREPVFADPQNVVVGDMMGLRRADAVAGPLPDPMPDGPPVDPATMP
jgi:hypothetical protein